MHRAKTLVFENCESLTGTVIESLFFHDDESGIHSDFRDFHFLKMNRREFKFWRSFHYALNIEGEPHPIFPSEPLGILKRSINVQDRCDSSEPNSD
jgi:hypothetical protein